MRWDGVRKKEEVNIEIKFPGLNDKEYHSAFSRNREFRRRKWFEGNTKIHFRNA